MRDKKGKRKNAWNSKKGKRDRLEFEVRWLELDRESHNKKSRQAACQQIKNWDDNTVPIAYLDNFELVMREAKFPRRNGSTK